MKRLIISTITLAMLAGAAFGASAPKDSYTEAEYTDLLNASSAAGALAGCELREMYENPEKTDEEAVRRLTAIFAPHAEEDSELGAYAKFSMRLYYMSQQRNTLVTLAPKGDGKYDVLPTPMTDEAACKAAEGTLKQFMKPGAVLDVLAGPQSGA